MEQNSKPQMQIHINQSPGAMIAFIVMIIGGIAAVVFGGIKIAEHSHFKNNCEKTTGTVMDYTYSNPHSNDDTRDGYYYAEYEYYVNGTRYFVKSNEHSSFPPDLGERDTVYYDPENPENARTTLKENIGAIYITCGLFVGFLGAALLLARFKANEEIIKILMGLVLFIIGFPLPIVAGAWVILIFTALFGVCGIIIIVKAITKLTGNEGGAVDQAIDEKLDAAGNALIDVIAATENGSGNDVLSNIDISPIKYIPQIIGGIGKCLFSLIFIVIGGFCVYKGEMVGAIFFVIGLGIFISGLVAIKHALDIRKEYKITKMF